MNSAGIPLHCTLKKTTDTLLKKYLCAQNCKKLCALLTFLRSIFRKKQKIGILFWPFWTYPQKENKNALKKWFSALMGQVSTGVIDIIFADRDYNIHLSVCIGTPTEKVIIMLRSWGNCHSFTLNRVIRFNPVSSRAPELLMLVRVIVCFSICNPKREGISVHCCLHCSKKEVAPELDDLLIPTFFKVQLLGEN